MRAIGNGGDAGDQTSGYGNTRASQANDVRTPGIRSRKRNGARARAWSSGRKVHVNVAARADSDIHPSAGIDLQGKVAGGHHAGDLDGNVSSIREVDKLGNTGRAHDLRTEVQTRIRRNDGCCGCHASARDGHGVWAARSIVENQQSGRAGPSSRWRESHGNRAGPSRLLDRGAVQRRWELWGVLHPVNGYRHISCVRDRKRLSTTLSSQDLP